MINQPFLSQGTNNIGQDSDALPENSGLLKSDEFINDLIRQSTPGERTRGVTDPFDFPGDFDKANKIFDSMNLKNVKPIETRFGPGRAGRLPDGSGRKVVVRPGSGKRGNIEDGPPTLEIQQGKGRIKFRFKGN